MHKWLQHLVMLMSCMQDHQMLALLQDVRRMEGLHCLVSVQCNHNRDSHLQMRPSPEVHDACRWRGA